MQIVCASKTAAAAVVTLLLRATLRPAHDFTIHPVFMPLAPITFTPRAPLPDALLKQIAAVPETLIVRQPRERPAERSKTFSGIPSHPPS
jgi:hypothetical protein